jgi:hypothetical protein
VLPLIFGVDLASVCILVYLTTLCQLHRSVRVVVKGGVCGLFCGTVPVVAWMDWANPVRITGTRAWIEPGISRHKAVFLTFHLQSRVSKSGRFCTVFCFRGEGRDSRWARQVCQVRQLAATHVPAEEEHRAPYLRVLVPRESHDQLWPGSWGTSATWALFQRTGRGRSSDARFWKLLVCAI